MSQLIRFKDSKLHTKNEYFSHDHYIGEIFLRDNYETLYANASVLTQNEYETQWKQALNECYSERRVTAFLASLNYDGEGYGMALLYTLIPAEDAVGTKAQNLEGIVVTNRFVPITSKSQNFEKMLNSPELVLFFAPPDRIDLIYRYLDTNVFGLSNWHFTNKQIESTIQSWGGC